MSTKLKSIYEAFDNGNYKHCLKLCSAFLQKQPGHALCKVLHAVALERCGRRDEALRLCDEALAAPSGVDDTVRNTAAIVFRRCRQGSSVFRVYEAGWAADADNEEYAASLYTAALRVGEFARAQQVATKLYSKLKKTKFVNWIVVALLFQGRSGAPSQILDLATIMLQKAPIDKDLLNGERGFNRTQHYLVLMHLDTLRMRGKFDEALELVKTCEPILKLPSDIAALRTQLLREAGRLQEAAAEAKATFIRKPDDWSSAREYIRLAFECPTPEGVKPQPWGGGTDHARRLRLGDTQPPASLEEFASMATDDEVRNAMLLVRHFEGSGASEGGPQGGRERTARLAQLELWRTAFCANEASALAAGEKGVSAISADWRAGVCDEDLAAFAALVKDYYFRFAATLHCFFDLKPFITLLSDDQSAALLEAAPPSVEGDHRAATALATTVGRLRRALGRSLPALEEVQQLLSPPAAGGAEQTPSLEKFLLAIVQLIDMDRARVAGGRECLVNALALAEEGLARDSNAFHFKVVLVLLYGALGLPGPMLKTYQTLEVKNVQHETVSYLVLDALAACGLAEQLREASGNIIGFHEDFDKDAGSSLQSALQSGVYHRLPEYLQSLDTMGRSILWARAVLDEALCEIGQAQTWEVLQESASRQRTVLADIMRRGTDDWAVCQQDRCLLNGLHPLPSGRRGCSPMQAEERHSAEAWKRGGKVPVVSLLGARSAAVGSSGLHWPPAAAAASEPSQTFSPPPRVSASEAEVAEESAPEELLLRGGRSWTPARLALSAAMQHLLAALLQRTGADDALVAESVLAARAASVREAGSSSSSSPPPGAPLTPPTASEARRLFEDSQGSAGALWGASSSSAFLGLGLRCGLHACEVAGTCVKAMVGEASWELAETQISEVGSSVQALLDAIGGGGVASLALGGLGVPALWALLHNCLGVVLPVVLWCCASLPKAGGSGKKVKQGQEALHAVRVALKGLLAALQTGLGELQELVTKAQAEQPEWGAGDVEGAPVLKALPGHADRCGEVRRTATEAHAKHLRALHEAVACRVALLKSRGAFKP